MTVLVIWIVGGQDKGNDYAQLTSLVEKKVKRIIAMGLDNSPILSHFNQGVIPISAVDNLNDAMLQAMQFSVKGDIVLLSPACASFDLFKNYMDRGNQFKEWVLKKNTD